MYKYRSDRQSGDNRSSSYKGRAQSSSSAPRRFTNTRSSFGGRGNGGGRRKRGGGEYIDVSRFVKKAIPQEEKIVEITHKFSDFPFAPEVHKNLEERNYVNPTPIQDKAIPYILEGKDLVGLAATGTGKTAAFLLPLINKVRNDRSQKVLIIAPTRELALQIDSEFRLFARGMKMFSASCVGGMPIFRQIQDLRRDHNFVIGTPGRLNDLAKRGVFKYESFQNVVLDEVDHMFDMGFVDEITVMLNSLPKERQSLFFSATMPPKIKDLIQRFTKDPVIIELSVGITTDNVDQDIIRVLDRSMKFDELHKILSQPELSKVLIFSETKVEVDRLTFDLSRKGHRVESIHGDKRQRERQRAITMFKESKVTILVATDVAARGLDIPNVTHVINYTTPQTYEDYVHRIGRTGRGNKTGKALTFV